MKKNKMLRLASALLVVVLMTTSIVGGTFAKYTTTGGTSDTARVAKWGVSITMSNDDAFFASTYAKTDSRLTATHSVVAATNGGTQDKVVAPGTSGSATLTIAGMPEVAVELDVAVGITQTVKIANNTECVLPAGKFEDTEVKVKPTADYEPITFKLEKEAAGGT